MKYWRGYLVALIAAACSWGLIEFSKGHGVLVDMIYPYATRMVQGHLSEWSAGIGICIWQVLLVVLVVLALASVMLMILLKWNIIQWFGWITAVASLVFLLHTGMYGLNDYAGPLSDDIRLDMTDYTVTELENTTNFFRERAVALAVSLSREADGSISTDTLEALSEEAAACFRDLTYEQKMAVYAGSLVPVKELAWADQFTQYGLTGLTVAITGESAINPQTPSAILPFAVCHEMAHRMSISLDHDANFSAFLACNASQSEIFQYAANLMAFRYCYNALSSLTTSTAVAATKRVEQSIGKKLQQDLAIVEAFLAPGLNPESDGQVCNMLVSWHIQYYVLPMHADDEVLFDPQDESQVDLSGIVNAKP